MPDSDDAGLSDNPCWPKDTAPKDKGFVLMTNDAFYGGKDPPYDYKKAPDDQGSSKLRRVVGDAYGGDGGDGMVNRTFVA